MGMENLMDTNRLEAFYDAIIAIIVTVLVLELPQPETATIAGIFCFENFIFHIFNQFSGLCKSLAIPSCDIFPCRKNRFQSYLDEHIFNVCNFINSIFDNICCQQSEFPIK